MFRQRWMLPPILIAAALLSSCLCPPFVPIPPPDDQGVLDLDINYSDSWYRETFNYAREAENIRHFVLVMPESEAARADAGWIFTSLSIRPDSITVRDDRQEYAWGLEYLYDAPAGHFTGAFPPGTYAVAAAFIAAPLSREEAGAGDDALLWPGVTGGGASSEYQTVVIEAGERIELTIFLTDADGWACPWLYVFDGQTFQRRTEILRHLRGRTNENTERTPLGQVALIDGFIVLRLAEERDELAFIDALYLYIGDAVVRAEDGPAAGRLAAADGDYLILRRGETVELRFRAPDSFAEGDLVSAVVTGYYLPLD